MRSGKVDTDRLFCCSAHLVLNHRSNNYVALGPRTKSWIKAMRIVQLCLRVLELIGAAGLLALLILLDNIETLAGWVMRITVCPLPRLPAPGFGVNKN